MDKKELEELKKKELGSLFMELGAGVLDSQTFEYDMRYLIFMLYNLKLAEFENLNIDEVGEGNTKHTIGALMKILRNKINIETSDDEILGLGIESRNELIHHHIVDNIEGLVSASSRERMVLETRALRRNIQKADKVIKRFVEELIPVYGLSAEKYLDMVKGEFLNSIQSDNQE
jgi:hypothetical protein